MMKITTALILLAALLATVPAFARGHRSYAAPRSSVVHVRGHVTKAGTYIAPSYRTAPDHTKLNNWSSKPNVNPYTGRSGTKDPYAPPSH